jgi:tetratricopeptide (TPR) repeat protein
MDHKLQTQQSPKDNLKPDEKTLPTYWNGLALEAENKSDWKSAIYCSRLALDICNSEKLKANILRHLSWYYLQIHEYSEVIAIYDKMYDKVPISQVHEDMLRYRAIAFRGLGKYAESLACHNQHSGKWGSYEYTSRAVTFEKMGLFQMALGDFLMSTEPNNDLNIARVFIHLEKYDRAMEICHTKLRICNNSKDIAKYLELLAHCEPIQKQCDKSVQVETKMESSKVEAKIDAPKVDAPKVDATKVDATKVDATKVDATKVDATKVDATKVESQAQTSKIDTKVDAPNADTKCLKKRPTSITAVKIHEIFDQAKHMQDKEASQFIVKSVNDYLDKSLAEDQDSEWETVPKG